MPKSPGKTKVKPHALADCRWVAMALIGDGGGVFISQTLDDEWELT